MYLANKHIQNLKCSFRLWRIFFISLLICCIMWPTTLAMTVQGPLIYQPDSGKGQQSDYSNMIQYYRGIIPKLMKEANVLGLSIAVVDEKSVIWAQGFGFTTTDKKTKVTPETMFNVQEISATFTTTAIMMAVQDGLVNLDAPITTYLPNFKVNSRFEDYPEQKITLRHLLSHTAGFTNEAPVGNDYDVDQASFKDHIRSISNTWLRCPVGERYYYSNLGIDLAGYILQVVSKKPFEQYVQEKLLNPLGMSQSTFDLTVIKKLKNRAVGQNHNLKHIPVIIPMMPAAALYTNAVQIAKFLQFQLNDGVGKNRQLLAKKYLKIMRTIPFPVKGQTEGYTLGIWKGYSYQADYYCHDGRGFGFMTNMVWYPEFKLGIVILTNSEDNSFISQLSNQIYWILIGLKRYPYPISKTIENPKFYNINPAILKKYAGHYIGRISKTIENPIFYNINPAILKKYDGHYIDRDEVDIKYDHHTLTAEGLPVQFTSQNECYIFGDDYSGYKYRFVPYDDVVSDRQYYIVRVNDGQIWDYNDGPNDEPGLNDEVLRQYVGRYSVKQYGQIVTVKKVYFKNGYLYVDNLRVLDEFQPGLFFTATGETADLSGRTLTLGNIRSERCFPF